MAQMIRKQIYLEPRQNALLKRLARTSGFSEAELIRQAIDRQVMAGHSGGRDPSAWARERAFIAQRLAAGPATGRRSWTREELYDERLSRRGRSRSG